MDAGDLEKLQRERFLAAYAKWAAISTYVDRYDEWEAYCKARDEYLGLKPFYWFEHFVSAQES